jgi:hypothetical protein
MKRLLIFLCFFVSILRAENVTVLVDSVTGTLKRPTAATFLAGNPSIGGGGGGSQWTAAANLVPFFNGSLAPVTDASFNYVLSANPGAADRTLTIGSKTGDTNLTLIGSSMAGNTSNAFSFELRNASDTLTQNLVLSWDLGPGKWYWNYWSTLDSDYVVAFSIKPATNAVDFENGLNAATINGGTYSGNSSGTNTGDQDLSLYALTSALAGYVPVTRTVNGHALSGNVTVTASDVSLGGVTNDVQTKAAIVPNTAPSSAQVLVGNAGGTAYAPVSLSGKVTITSAGVASVSLASGDIPNNAANTTGSAATLTTPRSIYGNNFDGSAALSQIIASTYGGTGNGFAKLAGPAASEKTWTGPNASATLLTDNAAVTVAQGLRADCRRHDRNRRTADARGWRDH